ncbi:MAG: hypothetical protein EZS28_001587 [Streblomastix strix]|uniref:Plant heme peroxidase family profile domain-containing protein n=1 Tax=Streblomastix strix TaxID=222440 RepID=A0A5J4X6Q6_9EUKA|nr:MAG: hypothetical protein EZS28_001587 [Streblomastix strix]
MVRCVESCPQSKFNFRMDNGTNVCIKPCATGQIPLDMHVSDSDIKFPSCVTNNCTITNSQYINLTSTTAWDCISQSECSSSHMFPTHFELQGQQSYYKCVAGEVEKPYDQGSKYFYVKLINGTTNVNCLFDKPCKELSGNYLAYKNISQLPGHLIFLLGDIQINVVVNIDTNSSQQRLFASYPIGGTNQYNIDIGQGTVGRFNLEKGWLVFKQIVFVVQDNDKNNNNFLLIIRGKDSSTNLIDCRFKWRTSGRDIDRGFVSCVSDAQLTIESLTVDDGLSMSRQAIVNVDGSAGAMTVNNSFFRNIRRLSGAGAAIECTLTSGSGGITIFANTTFEECVSIFQYTQGSISTSYDIGALYCKVTQGQYHSFDFRGCSYRVGRQFTFGKGLFLESDNMVEMMRRPELVAHYGEIYIHNDNLWVIDANPQKNEIYMMGVQMDDREFTVPLHYMVNDVTSGIYHISNPNTTTYKYNPGGDKGFGNDNDACGWVRFPCVTFGKAVSRSIEQHPDINAEVKIGIVQGYVLSTTTQINAQGHKVSLSKQLNFSDETDFAHDIEIIVQENGQLVFSNGSLSVSSCTFIARNTQSAKYIIIVQANTLSLELKSCQLKMDTNQQNIYNGLVEINGGTVLIESLITPTTTALNMIGCNLIKINNGVGKVIISNSIFSNVTSTGTNGGSVLFAEIDNRSSGVTLQNLQFIGCNSIQSNGKIYGGAVQIYATQVNVGFDHISFTDCKGLNGGAMYVQLLSQSQLLIHNQCNFTTCSDISQSGGGGGLYLDISSYSTAQLNKTTFSTCQAQQYGGGLFVTLQGGGILSIMNSTVFTSCSCVKANDYQEGGAIDVIIKDGNSRLQIQDQTSFTGCTCRNFGGAININGSNGSFIDIKQTTFTSCSSQGGGGLNIALKSGCIMNITDAVNFILCESASSNGGGMRAELTEAATSLFISGNSKFDQCKATVGQGGAMYILASQSKIIDINAVVFDKCSAIQGGGAISIVISNGGSFSITGSTNFSECKTTGSTDIGLGGGAVCVDISDAASQFQVMNNVVFDKCTSAKEGGAIFLKADMSQLNEINHATFKNCTSAKEGGGIYASVTNGGAFDITNEATFTECKSTSESGGGLYASVRTTTSVMMIRENVKFDRCESEKQGGGAYVSVNQCKNNKINKMNMLNCKAQTDGSGLFIEVTGAASFTISNETTFTDCVSKGTGSGGGIYAIVADIDSRLVFVNRTSINNCNSSVSGGGIYLLIRGRGTVQLGEATIQNSYSPIGAGIFANILDGSQLQVLKSSNFSTCTATGANGLGGGIYADIGEDCVLYLEDSIKFDTCKSTYGKGGGAYFIISKRAEIYMNKVDFIDCSSYTGGGAVYITMESASFLQIQNQTTFNDCTTSSGNGGGIYATIKDIDSKIIINDGSKFEACTSTGIGGAVYIESSSNATIEVNKAEFTGCVAADGGAIQASLLTGSTLTITNQTTFKSCISSAGSTSGGGGINVNVETNGKLYIQDGVEFDTCTSASGKGGAGNAIVKGRSVVELNSATFKNCSSANGGGLYITLEEESQLTITNSNLFNNCTASGSGGGLYATVKDPDSKVIIRDNSKFNICKSTNGNGGGAYIEGTNQASIEINKATIENCNSIQGGGIYCDIKTQSSLQVTNSNLFKGCKSTTAGGGLYAKCDGINSKMNISGFTQFDSCSTTGTSGQGGGSYLQVSTNASFELNKVTYKGCSAVDGGGLFGDYNKANKFIITSSNYFIGCSVTERGGGMYIKFTDDPETNFLVGSLTEFKENLASQQSHGRDIFVYCNNFNFLEAPRRLLFDVFSPLYDMENAIYGTEFWTNVLLHHDPGVDQNLIDRYKTYFGDELYISNVNQTGNDEEQCGGKGSACSSFTYAKTKVKTPEWRPQTIKTRTPTTPKVVHTYITVESMQILEPFTSEADEVVIRGVTPEEFYPENLTSLYSKIEFGEKGQIIISDLARWQEEEDSEYLDVNGVDQKFTFQYLEFVLPEKLDVDSLILVKGNPSDSGIGREVEVLIQNCLVSQEPNLTNGVQCIFFKSDPYLSSREKVIFDNIIADPLLPSDGIKLNNGSLIEITYEPEIILQENYLQFKDSLFKYVRSEISAWNITETLGETNSQVPLGAGSVITIRASSSVQLPFHFVDCTFENCEMNMNVKITEKNQLGIGGVIGIFVKNAQVELEHFRFIDCIGTITFTNMSLSTVNSENEDKITSEQTTLPQSSLKEKTFDQKSQISISNELKKPNFQIQHTGALYIGTAGNNAEGRFEGKKKIVNNYKNKNDTRQDFTSVIDAVHKPIIKLSSCVIKKCKTQIINSGRGIRVIQSGGVIVHTDRIGANVDLKSSIFESCISTVSQINSPSNKAIISSPFEPLWQREQRLDGDGGGLVVSHGTSKPLVKGSGVQFINCTAAIWDIYENSKSPGQMNAEGKQMKKIQIKEDMKQQNQINDEKLTIKEIGKPYIRPVIIQPSAEDISHLFLRQNSEIKSNLNVVLKKGRFSSKMISLQGTQLAVKGEGESLSSIMQKESSQHLFTLQDSQLDASEMRAELWGASASLIHSEGSGRSIISGLRVGGNKLEDGISNGAAFEVTLGELVLIDVKVERITLIQNENERNSDTVDKVKMSGLIVMKENAKLLRLEKCFISNINMEDGGSAILSNGGLNSRLEIKDCNFIQESNAPWSGSAIRYIPTNQGQVLDVDGAVFSVFTADTQYNSQGGAIYVDMRVYDVEVKFRRCVFHNNVALNGGTNVFIAYKQSSQRAQRESFLGCHACTSSSVDQEKSFQYTIGNDNELFIDESDILHSSWIPETNNVGVWYIGIAEGNHTYDPNIKCGLPTNPCPSFTTIAQLLTQYPTDKVETIQFCEGSFNSPQIIVPATRGNSINIVGYGSSLTEISASSIGDNALIQGQGDQSVIIERIHMTLSNSQSQSGFVNVQGSNAALILSEVRVSGLAVSDPSSSSLSPKYLFRSAGLVFIEDVVIVHVFLNTGSIILAEQVRKPISTPSKGIEWLGLRSSGIYSSFFNEITTNESKIISIRDSSSQSNSISNKNNNLQSNAEMQSFIIHDTIFSSCVTSVNIADTETKGGLIHIVNNGVKVDIISSEFRRCQVLGRNMIYIGWNGVDTSVTPLKTIMISDTIFAGCSALIPGMRAVAQSIQNPTTYLLMQGSNTNGPDILDNELYSDGRPTYDEVYKHGLIYLESFTVGDKQGISSTRVDLYGTIITGCHSAVAAGLNCIKLTLYIIESTFVTPMCYSNVLYLNQTRGYIQSSFFKGRNETYTDPTLVTQSGDVADDTWELCPGQPRYYSSTTHGLVYVTKGTYQFDGELFEQTQVGALKVDTADVVLNNISFIEPKLGEEALYDGGQYLVMCIGKSHLEIIDTSVNGFNEDNCSFGSNYQDNSSVFQQNDASQCTLNILKDSECQMKLSYKWTIPPIPIVRIEKARLNVNISDEEEPFQFEVEGQNFIPLLFTMMIDTVRLKTQEEIHEEVEKYKDQKPELNQVYNYLSKRFGNGKDYIMKDIEGSKKHEFEPQQLKIYKKSNDDVDLPRDKHGRIIWPPEDGTQVPFLVLADVHGTKRATFSMKDVTWLDARTYWYGVLASNNGQRFTGENGEEGKPVIIDIEVLYGEMFANYIEVLPSKTWLYLTIAGVIILVLIIVLIIVIVLCLRWAEIKKAILRRGQIQKIGNQEDEINEQIAEIEEEERKKQEAKKQKKLEKKQAQKKQHQDLLLPYEDDSLFVIHAAQDPSDLPFQEMTDFGKDGLGKNEGASRKSYSQGFGTDSPYVEAYAGDLKARLDGIEQRDGAPLEQDPNTKVLVEMPAQEKGTINQQIAEFFTNTTPTTIDFSAMNADDPQLRGINWGAAGPPATIGLGEKGVSRPPKELFELQKRQEKLLSKSTTGFTKAQSKRSSQSSFQGRPTSPPGSASSSQLNSAASSQRGGPTSPHNYSSMKGPGPTSPGINKMGQNRGSQQSLKPNQGDNQV